MPDAQPFPAATLARDLLLTALTGVGWTRVSDLGTAPQLLLAVLTLAIAFFAHEWGHWLAGRAAGAVLHRSRSVAALFLFQFDRSNSVRQFVAMSSGGFAASAAAVVVLAVVLPAGHLATTATHVLVGIGVVVTLVVEVPELLRVVRTGEFPEGFAYTDGGSAPG